MKLHIIKTTPNQRMLWTDGKTSLIAKGRDLVCHERNGRARIVRCPQGRWKQDMVVGQKGSRISIAALNMHGPLFERSRAIPVLSRDGRYLCLESDGCAGV